VSDPVTGNWLVDNIRIVLDSAVAIVVTLTAVVGYRVNVILFNMKIPERLAVIENELKNLNARVKNLEAYRYGKSGDKS
jgi:hypothetical protein